MGAWLSVTLKLSQIRIVQIIIALVALVGAFVNLRSFNKERKKDAGCQVVDDKKRKTIIDSVKKFTTEKSLLLAIIGAITLAISVNFVELACSAGLPLLFTQILALNDLNSFQYFIYMLIYIICYMLDDIIIFLIAMVTLKLTGISNKYNKYSHLIGGLIMLIIGLLMIFKPEWIMMNF
jgi:cytochrome c biogenesis protein CcdA